MTCSTGGGGAGGEFLAAVVWMLPIQTDAVGDALCAAGVGVLVTILLFLASLGLLALSAFNLIEWFAKKGSRRSQLQTEANDHARAAGLQMFGAVIVGMLPVLLAAAGFSLLDCIEPVNVFGAIMLSGFDASLW